MASIRENGFFAPCAVQVSTRYVCIGNHRLRAAVELGMTHVPVVWLEVDDDAVLRIVLADNRASDLATNNDADLAALLQELDEAERGLAGTLYDGDDLDALLASLNEDPVRRRLTDPQPSGIGTDCHAWLSAAQSPAASETAPDGDCRGAGTAPHHINRASTEPVVETKSRMPFRSGPSNDAPAAAWSRGEIVRKPLENESRKCYHC
jgi:hypothetical protein